MKDDDDYMTQDEVDEFLRERYPNEDDPEERAEKLQRDAEKAAERYGKY